LALRLLTAAVGLPVLLGAVWLGAPWLTLLVLLAGAIGLREVYRLTPLGAAPLPLLLGTVWVAAILLAAQAASGLPSFLAMTGGVTAAGAFAAALWYIAFYRGGQYAVGLAFLLLGPLYVGFLLAHSLALRELPYGDEIGRNWLLFALLTTFAADTGAYAVGRAVGRAPLAPSISPNKTWEGSIGGFTAAVAAALLVGLFLDLGLAGWQQAVIGATVGAISQAGDLLESWLKRLSNAKDAGSIIPGHGGILDRMDSILLALPAVYYLLGTVFEP
jgi:phosphatidate cytidylyltransferase